jgi:hypothetical protein
MDWRRTVVQLWSYTRRPSNSPMTSKTWREHAYWVARFLVVLFWAGIVGAACVAQATVGPGGEECRNVEVRNRHDVEVCHQRCGDEGCREHCAERERWSHEHRCWAD